MSKEFEARDTGKGNMLRIGLIIGVVVLAIALGFVSYFYAQASSQSSEKSATVASLEKEVASYKSQIPPLQDQLSTAKSQLASATAEVASLKTQVSTLQGQASNLQSIVSLTKSTAQLVSATINQGPSELTSMVKFKADYAGYVVISGTSTSQTGYIRVTDSYVAYPYNLTNYFFGTGATLLIPVLPGNIDVLFGNKDVGVGVTTTMTVTYYY